MNVDCLQESTRYYPPGRPPQQHPPQYERATVQIAPPPSIEECHIGIPNYAVGAVIGAAGANIKRIIRDSNAVVTVCLTMSV